MKTPNYFLTLMMGTTLALFALSCDNSEEAAPEKPKPDGQALLQKFSENLAEAKQTFTLDAAAGGSITGEQGTVIQFAPNGLKKLNGDAVTGNVTIELVEIFSKADMLMMEMPTKGKTADGKIATLISGGEFFINATQGGNQLKPADSFQLIVPADKTGGGDVEMTLFNGKDDCTNADCDIVWEQKDRKGIQVGEKGGATGAGGVQTVYYAFQNQFGWTNIDKWYSDPRPKTTIFVDVPEGYDDTNCAVYLSYDGEPTALAKFDMYDGAAKLFTEHYGLIPIGLEAHFIMVSIVNDQYQYAIQAATITNNHVQVIGSLQPTTEEALVDLINDLP